MTNGMSYSEFHILSFHLSKSLCACADLVYRGAVEVMFRLLLL
jgi:hypothetical protein